MASSPWPMPLVSTSTRSHPTAWQASIALLMQPAISLPLSLLATERMNRCSSESEFIRILSPRSAPPVRFRVGAVASSATLLPGLSRWILSMISSVKLDLPAPPVPVRPTTGQASSTTRERTRSRTCMRACSDSMPRRKSATCWLLASMAALAALRRSRAPSRSVSIACSRVPRSRISSSALPALPRAVARS